MTMGVATGSSLSIAIGAGVLAAVNPCGFALLPAYLTAFVVDDTVPSRVTALGRALRATVALTAGFVAVFATFGLLVMPVAAQVLEYTPAFTVVTGLVLATAGGWVLAGRRLPTPVIHRRRRIQQARPLVASLPTMVGFGVSYAVASLGCTLAPFLAVVVTGLRSADPWSGAVLFLGYAVGMGLVVAVASTAVALTRTRLIVRLRRGGTIAARIGGLVLLLSGLYIAWYGTWELRVLHTGATNDSVVAVASHLQFWIANHVAGLGPAGLAIALLVLAALAVLRRPTHPRKENPMRMQAVFNDQVIAESDETVVVEGNHYFPAESLRREFISNSDTHTTCAWKGTASYYNVVVNGRESANAVWFYPTPSAAAAQIENRVAFWRGVQVRPAPAQSGTVTEPPTFDAPEGATC